MAKREYSLSAAEIARAMRRDCLRAPAADAKRLAAVRGNPEIGDFQLQVLLNKDERELRRRIFDFFDKCHRDDVLRMHVSSHGIKDDRGHLYLAASDTKIDALGATAVDPHG